MAALRRGIAHYADGTPDVGTVQPPMTMAQRLSLANAAQNAPYGYTSLYRGAPAATVSGSYSQPDVASAASPPPPAPSGGGGSLADQERAAQAALKARQAAAAAPSDTGTPAPAPLTVAQQISAASDTSSPAYGYTGNARSQPASAPDLVPVPPSGHAQLLSGQFKEAAENPASSPVTAALGRFMDYVSRANRVAAVGRAPTASEQMAHLFSGDQASTEALANRAVFRDPLVSQYLMTDENALKAAETDPANYAKMVQTPDFKKHMVSAVNTYNDVHVNGARHVDEHGEIVKTPPNPAETARLAQTTGATTAQAYAAQKPGAYTKEEFRRVFLGAPLPVVEALFGEQFKHVVDPKEALTKTYFGALQERQALDEEASKTADKVRLAEIAARRQQLLNIMDASAPPAGIVQPLPGVPGKPPGVQ